MQSKGNAPTAAQKKWREEIRELGCIVHGDKGEIEIHHVLGATAKHNKVAIGHWFILPLTGWFHRLNPELNVTSRKRAFEINFGSQVSLFDKLMLQYEFVYEKCVPLDPEVIAAIRDLEVSGV